MDWLTLLVLAVGLAMDAMAVSTARGLVSPRRHEGLLLAIAFGGFQAAMPAAGWWLGAWMGPLVDRWIEWIAGILLAGIGLKMLWDSHGEPEEIDPRPLGIGALLVLAIATSIDAFAAGVSLQVFELPLLLSVGVIGGVAAGLSALGFSLGHRIGGRLGGRLERFGGVVLLLLAAKALLT